MSEQRGREHERGIYAPSSKRRRRSRSNRASASTKSIAAEGVDDSESTVVLLVVHVLRVNCFAANDSCRRQYRSIPVGDAETVAEFRGPPEDPLSHRLYGYSPKGFNEPESLLMGQPVGSGLSGSLVVELGQHLD